MQWLEELRSNRLTFSNVPVGPIEEVLAAPAGSLSRCGPKWPDFENQIEARHCRGREIRAVDDVPEFKNSNSYPVINEAIWCGPVVSHFGHMIADFGMRIAQSAALTPNVPLLFAVGSKASKVNQVPSYFFAMLDHFNIDHARAIFIDKPVHVKSLHVYPQAERMNGGAPTSTHLHFMDSLSSAPPLHGDIRTVYVSRSRYLYGGIAGESYINRCLTDAGVLVICPEVAPLGLQLEIIRRAKNLIFAEGSAVHALQLQGTIHADVTIVCRRPKARIAEASISPRARSLNYADCVRRNIFGLRRSGHNHESKGITFHKKGTLRKIFSDIVPEVRQYWDNDHFLQEQIKDIHRWCDLITNSGDRHPNEREEIRRHLGVIDIPVPDCLKQC